MAKQAEIVEGEDKAFFIPATRQEVVSAVSVGFAIGVMAPLLTWLLTRYFVEPVFCHSGGDALSICTNSGNFAFNIGTIVLAFVGVVLLAQLRVYRPLLVAVAAAVALWGLKKYLDGLVTHWGEYYLWFGVLYALAYLLFFWLLRIRNFPLSLGMVAIAIVVVQLVLNR